MIFLGESSNGRTAVSDTVNRGSNPRSPANLPLKFPYQRPAAYNQAMRNCDTCPGNTDCAGTYLHPVLSQVLGLYAAGTTDKFDILFSLGEENEALLEKYDDQISKACWTKAALLAIADIITDKNSDNWSDEAPVLIASAVAAFERFPWQITELIEQAPDLYQAIFERQPDGAFAADVSKRAFVKFCKTVAYQ